LEMNQLFREHPRPVSVASGPTNLHPHVAAIGPTQFRKPLYETGKEGLYLRIAFVPRHEHANPPNAADLLRAHCERPSASRYAEERDELAPLHSITSSAMASTPGDGVSWVLDCRSDQAAAFFGSVVHTERSHAAQSDEK
jgi:hypothetical protein